MLKAAKIVPKTRLPLKASALLALAIEDIEHCEKDPSFEINMDVWLGTDDCGNCVGCLAGTLMKRSLKLEPKYPKSLAPLKDAGVTSYEIMQLHAIDRMRRGHWEGALINLLEDLYPPSHRRDQRENILKDLKKEIIVVEYNQNPRLWKSAMRKATDIMKSHGF